MEVIFKFYKLQNKIFFYFLLLALIPLVSLGIASYVLSTKSFEQQTTQHQSQTIHLIANNIKLMLDDASDLSSYMINNEGLQQLLLQNASLPLNSGQSLSLGYLEKLKQAKKYITFLVIYGENGFLYRDFSEFFRQVTPYGELLETPLYIATAAKDPKPHLTFSSSPLFIYGQSYNEIMIGRRISNMYDHDQKLGMLFMGINRDSFMELIKDIEILKSTNIFIYDDNYNLVSGKYADHELKTQLGEDLKLKQHIFNSSFNGVQSVQGKQYFVSSSLIQPYSWNVVSFTPMDITRKQHETVLKFTFFLSLALLAAVGIISAVLSRSVTTPLKKLLQSMNSFKRGDFHQKVEISSNDEIGLLSKKYNEMVFEINELVQKVFVSQTNQKIIELKTLQTQIQPHFLYNTLDFIFLNSKMNADEQTAEVVQSLSELFRLSLNKGNDVYTVGDEIRQIKAYINIQHARFPHLFTPVIDVDPDITSCYTMKLLLQPIVENAILHSFKEPGTLKVTGGFKGDRISMSVEDTGCGMSQEQVEQLLTIPLKSSGGYGVRNVNERLQMMFGKEYALHIESTPGQGTKVTIQIPIIHSVEQWRNLYENHGY